MSLLKKLFGIGGASERPAAPTQEIEHNGFTIRATPFENGGRYQLCGIIVGSDGVEEKFIRADAFGSLEEAVDMTFFKGKQIIDLRNARMPS
ncbi:MULTISPECIES: HlyU family transcriptional regulator [unclassified Beijerinckia]|uniref:HlyU family transcriptional regulator n=1 Tax=unclassified Beijerinckia TaxID=2638183 RepID=UPI0008988860|nr:MULTISPECIES: HlyU family transcriptional regulator [unclassified Beijerinckia]MDH7798621.1 hypothetical protein [Beijerinckia sp. GAS462]SED26987.1 hypothetical protein SAMN05443249_4920 [Beijerinckia sp. 28-YEA-48]